MNNIFKKATFILLPMMLTALCTVFTSCSDDDDPVPQYETVKIEGEVSRIAVPLNNTEGILTNPNMGIEGWMCNNADQVKLTQTPEFLSRYPEVLNVDFSKYTLVFYRTLVLNYSDLDKVDYYFSRCIAKRDEPGYGTYRVNSTLYYDNGNDWTVNDNDSYIMQIAFLVPRIKIAAPVTVNEGVLSIHK